MESASNHVQHYKIMNYCIAGGDREIYIYKFMFTNMAQTISFVAPIES